MFRSRPFKTVDQLLAIIEESKATHIMTVSYDQVHLFPRLIEIEGSRYEISDWEVLP